MSRYQVQFEDGLTVTTHAADRSDAQELAIADLEQRGVCVASIVSIRRLIGA